MVASLNATTNARLNKERLFTVGTAIVGSAALVHFTNFYALDAPEANAVAAALGVVAFDFLVNLGCTLIEALRVSCCANASTTASITIAAANAAASTAAAFRAVELVTKVVAINVRLALVHVRHDVVVLEVELSARVRYAAVAVRKEPRKRRSEGRNYQDKKRV